MSYDAAKSSYGSFSSSRSAPATKVIKLTAAMLSDTSDLAVYAKALRVWNGSTAAITLMVTPEFAPATDLAADAVPITVPSGTPSYEPISVRRIWSTGSTGLAAALAAGTVEVLILTL